MQLPLFFPVIRFHDKYSLPFFKVGEPTTTNEMSRCGIFSPPDPSSLSRQENIPFVAVFILFKTSYVIPVLGFALSDGSTPSPAKNNEPYLRKASGKPAPRLFQAGMYITHHRIFSGKCFHKQYQFIDIHFTYLFTGLILKHSFRRLFQGQS